jgi:hypothetical protein
MNRTRFGFLAALLVGGATGACDKKCKECPPPSPALPCPSVTPTAAPTPCVPEPEPTAGGTAGGGGGPGACADWACKSGTHFCTKAKCLTPPSSSGGTTTDLNCEFGPTLIGVCRCHLGDKRQCGTTATWKTCVEVNATETKWGPCI